MIPKFYIRVIKHSHMAGEKINLIERVTNDVREPDRYKVIMHNDDFTTMEFVVKVLRSVFRHSESESQHLMLKIHEEGRAVVGIYSLDIAVTKVRKVTSMALRESYPLKVTYEKE